MSIGLPPTLFGLRVISTEHGTTIPPTPGEWARRFVRHSYAESGHMEWLGLEVGPRPDAPGGYQSFRTPGAYFMHPKVISDLRIVSSA